MFEAGTRKLVQKFLCLMLLTFCLFIFSRDSTKSLLASAQMSQEGSKQPTISVASQDDVPLRIVNSFTESLGPDDFRIRVIVQNQSNKKVRAFAVIAKSISEGDPSTRVEFVNLTSPTSILQPSQMTDVSVAYSPERLSEGLKLAVDFVEFSDGNTAGPDTHNSRDRLAGQREGAKREKHRPRNLLKNKGPAAVIDSVRNESASDPEPTGVSKPSEEWLEGFRSGVGSIRHRIKQAGQTSNPKQIEIELAKPFDLAEGNQK